MDLLRDWGVQWDLNRESECCKGMRSWLRGGSQNKSHYEEDLVTVVHSAFTKYSGPFTFIIRYAAALLNKQTNKKIPTSICTYTVMTTQKHNFKEHIKK